MHKPLALAAATALALGVAGPASAAQEESEWQPAPDFPAFSLEACGTEVTFDEAVSEVVERVTERPNRTRIEARGRLVYDVETADGRSAEVDASGPAKITILPTRTIVSLRGTNLLMAADEATARMHREHGLPTLALTQGPVLIHEVPGDEEGEYSLVLRRAPIEVVDVCTLLR